MDEEPLLSKHMVDSVELEHGLPFGFSERHNKFMLMKRMLTMSLLCSVIVACTSQHVTPVAISTNTAQPISTSTSTSTSTPEVTATGVLMPDGLIMLKPNRYKFQIWPLSFSFPNSWDIKNEIHLSSVDFGREVYTFYKANIENFDARQESPQITIFFETIPENSEIEAYSKNTWIKWHVPDVHIEKTFDPKEVGLNLETAIAFKTTDMVEDIEFTQYVIHAVHKTTGIEIIMNSKTKIFKEAELDFIDFLKQLSFD